MNSCGGEYGWRRALGACLATAALALSGAPAVGQLPFFPGAEGYGGTFAGSAPAAGWFSNATIYHVTNLNDSGAGSLRGAFVENSANKVIVFDVGGTITLTSGALNIKNLSNYYVAGQTAPSPVTVIGNPTQITHSADKINSNVIVRYLTFRKGTGGGDDAITFSGGDGAGDLVATNMILDHVSASWSEDEVLSVANNNTNVTVQYSIIADALVSNHAYGSLIRPRIDSTVSFHHNLYANNASRQARFGTYNAETLTVDFRNNVIYNWRDRASYAGGSSEAEQEFADVNYVGNYLVAGPNTIGSPTQVFGTDKNITARVYQSGNFVDSDKGVNPGGVPNGSLATNSQFIISPPQTDQTLTMMGAPFGTPAVTTQTAAAAYSQVMAHVGNYVVGSFPTREAVDARIIGNVLNNTGPPGGIGAAAPNAAELAGVTGAPQVSRTMSTWDTDNDGMPNDWELAHGLNPNSATDNKLDFDVDGYVNVVEYLNDAGAFPAPAPIVFNGATNTRYAQITNWRTNDGGVTAGSNWQPAKYDTAVIHNGTATVDAVGQHAGTLQVAPTAGDSASLNVTAGWLDVQTVAQVGLGGAGVVNHSGGLVLADAVALGGSGTYNLSGTGVLRVGSLTRTANTGAFNLTGGTLSADTIGFDLVNQGGRIVIGDSPGTTHVMGALTLDGGALEIELGGTLPGQYDRVEVDGVLTFGGTLKVSLVDLGGGTFVPQLGNHFPIFASAGTAEMFDDFDLPPLAPGLEWALLPGDVATFLAVVDPNAGNPADFNNDNSVDGEDFAIWSQGFGSLNRPDNSTGDATGDGAVEGGDFLVWQQQFGAGPGSTGVPEPASLALAALAVAVGGRRLLQWRA